MHDLAETFALVKNYAEAETLYRDAAQPAPSSFQQCATTRDSSPGISYCITWRMSSGSGRCSAKPAHCAEEAMTLYRRHARLACQANSSMRSTVLEAVLKDLGDSRALKAVRLEQTGSAPRGSGERRPRRFE